MRFHGIIAFALPLLASVASALAWASDLDGSDQLVSRYADHVDALESRFAGYDDELGARNSDFEIDTVYNLRSFADYELRSLADYLDDYLEARARRNSYSAKQARTKLTKNEQNARKEAVRNQVQANQARKAASGNRHRTPRPTMRKGDPKSAKSLARQATANNARKDRKAAGRVRFADVRKKSKAENTKGGQCCFF